MAATRLIALHIKKGSTVAQCLADRTDYSQNAEKTNGGEFVSSYECAPMTVDEEFLLSKRQYQHITGRQQKRDVIAYQIRQSFKPGEITPEEANQVRLVQHPVLAHRGILLGIRQIQIGIQIIPDLGVTQFSGHDVPSPFVPQEVVLFYLYHTHYFEV